MGQLSYNFFPPVGVAGSKFDISPSRVDSRLNGETAADVLLFGGAAFRGADSGMVYAPKSAAKADEFMGLVLNGFTNEMNMTGQIKLVPKATVGVLRWGVAWARVPADVEPSEGDPLYVITAGNDAGKFTNVATNNLEVMGRFTGQNGTGDIAVVEIYNQQNKDTDGGS